jgi:hypothetical protein
MTEIVEAGSFESQLLALLQEQVVMAPLLSKSTVLE